MQEKARVNLTFSNENYNEYLLLKKEAEEKGLPVATYIHELCRKGRKKEIEEFKTNELISAVISSVVATIEGELSVLNDNMLSVRIGQLAHWKAMRGIVSQLSKNKEMQFFLLGELEIARNEAVSEVADKINFEIEEINDLF